MYGTYVDIVPLYMCIDKFDYVAYLWHLMDTFVAGMYFQFFNCWVNFLVQSSLSLNLLCLALYLETQADGLSHFILF